MCITGDVFILVLSQYAGPNTLARVWEHTSIYKSSGGRSSQTSSDFSSAYDAGSTDS